MEFRTLTELIPHPAKGKQGWLISALAGILTGSLFVVIGSYISPLLILPLVAALGVVVSGMISPTVAFIFVTLVIPIERMGRFFDDSAMSMISLMRLAGLLALLSYGLHALIQRWKLRFALSFFLYGGYCLFAGLTLFYSKDMVQGLRHYGLLIGNLLFFFLVINVVRSWKLMHLALVVWISSSVLIGIFTIYSWHLGASVIVTGEAEIGATSTRFSTMYYDWSEWEALGGVTRAVGPTSGPAVYGINMIMTLPFLIYLLRFAQNNLLRGVWFLSIVIVLYNILLTNTRATMVGALAALLLSGVFRLYPIKPWRLIAVGMLALLLIPLTPNTVIRRALSYANYTYSQSATLRARVAFWQAWGKVAREHWLTGIGLGDDLTLSKYYDQSELPPRMSVHNHFLATFMELGLFGWLLFMAFLGSVFWSTQKAIQFFRNRPADHPQHVFLLGCQVCFFTLLLYGLQCDVFYMPLKGWWLIVGLSHSLYLQARREPSWTGMQSSA